MLCRNIHLDSSSHCLWSLLITWKWYLLCMYNFLNFYQRVRLFFSVFIQFYDVINKQEYSLWYWSWFAQQSCTTSSLFISEIYSIYLYLYWKFNLVTSNMSQVRGYTEVNPPNEYVWNRDWFLYGVRFRMSFVFNKSLQIKG